MADMEIDNIIQQASFGNRTARQIILGNEEVRRVIGVRVMKKILIFLILSAVSLGISAIFLFEDVTVSESVICWKFILYFG